MKIIFLLSMVSIFQIVSSAQDNTPVVQEISDINENFEVSVTISFKIDKIKDIDLDLVAKLKESVADDCECTFIETADADTKFEMNIITFIWLETHAEYTKLCNEGKQYNINNY